MPMASKDKVSYPKLFSDSAFTRNTAEFRPLLMTIFIQVVYFLMPLFSSTCVVTGNNDCNYKQYFLSVNGML